MKTRAALKQHRRFLGVSWSPVPRRVRLRPRPWVAALIFASTVWATNVAQAQSILQIGSTGQGRLLNLDAADAIQSDAFDFLLDGEPLNLEIVGGSVAIDGSSHGGLLLAGVRLDDFSFTNPTRNWKLFELDPVTRTARVLFDLPQPLSAMAVGPAGEIVGISYRPARFVLVNLQTGTTPFLFEYVEDQMSGSVYDIGEAGLIWVEERNAFLWLSGNTSAEFTTTGEEYRWLATDGTPSFPFKVDRPSLTPHQVVDLGGQLVVLGRNVASEVSLEGLDLVTGDRRSYSLGGFHGEIQTSGRAYFDVTDRLLCEPSDTVLCFGPDDRFSATVQWRDPDSGLLKNAFVRRLTADTGVFWFVDDQNLEVMVKLLDTCAFTNHYWVFGAASTDLEYQLRVTDRGAPPDTGTQRFAEYGNPGGQPAPAITDTKAIPCQIRPVV